MVYSLTKGHLSKEFFANYTFLKELSIKDKYILYLALVPIWGIGRAMLQLNLWKEIVGGNNFLETER